MNDRQNWITVTEVARLLGKSERTVRRWMTGGRLTWKDTPEGKLVDFASHSTGGGVTAPGIAVLEKENTRLQAEVDKLAELVRQLTDERDYLRRAHEASLSLVAQQQKLLPAPGNRPWWQFWRRDEEPRDE